MGNTLRAAAVFASLAVPVQAEDCNHFQASGVIAMSSETLGIDHLVAGKILANIDAAKHEICYNFTAEKGVTITPSQVCMRPGDKPKTILIAPKGLPPMHLALASEAVAEKQFRSNIQCMAL